MAEATEASSFFARIGRALRPGFQFGCRDLVPPLVLLSASSAAILWLSWSGHFLLAHIAVVLVIWVLPFLIFGLLVFWKPTRGFARTLNRSMLQLALFLAMLIPVTMAGELLFQVSLATSAARGKELATAIAAYREGHRRYPASLVELEANLGRPVPRPTVGPEFGYFASEDWFRLTFSWGVLEWYWDSRTGGWQPD